MKTKKEIIFDELEKRDYIPLTREIAEMADCSMRTARRVLAEYKKHFIAKNACIEEPKACIEKCIEKPLKPKEEINYNEDGTITGKLNLSTREDLYKRLNINKEFWDLRKFKNSHWETQIKGGEIAELTASSFEVSPLKEPLFDAEAFVKNCHELIQSEPIPIKINPQKCQSADLNKDKLMELPPIELHLGSLAWTGDSGYNYDSKIASERFHEIIRQVVDYQRIFKCEKLVLGIGGDFFNSDTESGTTTKGTILTNDLRWKKMFNIGCELWKSAIETLIKEFVTVEIRNVPGNHDRLSSYYLYEVIRARYEARQDVIFGKHTRELQEIEFGHNLIIMTHGEVNISRIMKSIPVEFAKEWGRTCNREVHLGHKHSENLKVYFSETIEEIGLIARRLATPKETDYWEYHERFVGAKKKHTCFVWDKLAGIDLMFNVNF